jgi:hypothetical protein
MWVGRWESGGSDTLLTHSLTALFVDLGTASRISMIKSKVTALLWVHIFILGVLVVLIFVVVFVVLVCITIIPVI